jgi:hypothetical protein
VPRFQRQRCVLASDASIFATIQEQLDVDSADAGKTTRSARPSARTPLAADAERFLQQWNARLEKSGLELHADKTRPIEFRREAAENRKQRGEGKPEVFDFLGFTHLCGTTRKTGRFIVKRKTIRKRLSGRPPWCQSDVWVAESPAPRPMHRT